MAVGFLDNIPNTADLIAAHHRASLGHDDVAQPPPVAAAPAAPALAEAKPEPEPAAPEEERKVANDGGHYTWGEFVQFYGDDAARYWREASWPAGDGADAESPDDESEPEALRGSERKKVNQLEELDPWASYTKGMFLGQGQYAEVYLVTDKNTGVEYGESIILLAPLTCVMQRVRSFAKQDLKKCVRPEK